MRFSSFAALFLTGLVTTFSATAIQLAAPSSPVIAGRSTLTWTHNASDPAVFRIELQLASDSWALGQIWEFVDTRADKLEVTWLNTWPYALNTRSIYRLLAVNQSFPDQIYTKSPTFRFLTPGSTVTTTSTSTSTKPSTVTTLPSSTTTKSTTASTSTKTSSVPVVTVTTTTSTTSSTSGWITPSVASPITSESLITTVTETATTAQDPTTTTGAGVLGNNNNAAGGLLVRSAMIVSVVGATGLGFLLAM